MFLPAGVFANEDISCSPEENTIGGILVQSFCFYN